MRRAFIEVINASMLIKASEARRVVRALEKQVRRDFAPAWGLDAELHLVTSGRPADPTAWQLVLLDDANTYDGYHELTKGGRPLGKVFVKAAKEDSGGYTSTASHELLELLANPEMSLSVFVETNTGPRIYEYEVCDPCQDDTFAYEIDGELVSDFVYPSWFDFFPAKPAKPAKAKARAKGAFDQSGHIRAPFQVLAGGYATYYDVKNREWRSRGPGKPPAQHSYGGYGSGAGRTRDADDARRRTGGSRRIRRSLPRDTWKRSLK